ncbi:MAG: type I-B CRISPR-associated protein Cas7/Csh2 [Lewinellaceae bacterium]|nr:type I-B CRISPR-associated protein Cas7/Csh2 [Lewinellaceae bacterium]
MAISNNSDFLFLYEAIQCNPNGDPDQENKPRMDYDTQTNLVTDVRVKRYIRDFLKQEGKEIFVDLESDAKVKMDQKLKAVLERLWNNEGEIKALINDDQLFQAYQEIKEDTAEATIGKLVSKSPANRKVNRALLSGLVRRKFIDIRMFGSAFAVDGFNYAMTGPIQLNWGYSLNRVYLMDSDTIASIMSDENSTFGKDYRVKYSLIAFHGAINKATSATTGLKAEDIEVFRSALWNSLSANPTRSKLNQYPKLYVEVVYNDGYYNGHFGDLRSYISARPKQAEQDREVRGYNDLLVDYLDLEEILKKNQGQGKPIKEVIVKTAADVAKEFDYGNA